MTDVYYRLVDSKDWQGRPTISCIRYRVIKETPKGFWIIPEYWFNPSHMDDSFKKFVLNDARKKHAYPTFELALDSYRIRKAKHVAFLILQHESAVKRANIAETLTEEMTANVSLQYASEQKKAGFSPVFDNPIQPVTYRP